MAICKDCGHTGGDADRFCTACGRRLPWNDGLGWIRRHWRAVVQFRWLASLFWFYGWLWGWDIRRIRRGSNKGCLRWY